MNRKIDCSIHTMCIGSQRKMLKIKVVTFRYINTEIGLDCAYKRNYEDISNDI